MFFYLKKSWKWWFYKLDSLQHFTHHTEAQLSSLLSLSFNHTKLYFPPTWPHMNSVEPSDLYTELWANIAANDFSHFSTLLINYVVRSCCVTSFDQDITGFHDRTTLRDFVSRNIFGGSFFPLSRWFAIELSVYLLVIV